MKLNENIYNLRKEKGLSQETLAEKVNVSRQTISNWELGETTPNPDQLILLSKVFEISIDRLVGNDIEEKKEKKEDARIFAICGSAINFIGLIIAILIWKEEQTSTSTAIGLILMVIGNMIFAIGQVVGKNRKNTRRHYFMINIWPLLLIPYACIYNGINSLISSSFWQLSPIPQLGNSYLTYLFVWLVYIGIGSIVDIILYKKK